jgi:hypothetical protein
MIENGDRSLRNEVDVDTASAVSQSAVVHACVIKVVFFARQLLFQHAPGIQCPPIDAVSCSAHTARKESLRDLRMALYQEQRSL